MPPDGYSQDDIDSLIRLGVLPRNAQVSAPTAAAAPSMGAPAYTDADKAALQQSLTQSLINSRALPPGAMPKTPAPAPPPAAAPGPPGVNVEGLGGGPDMSKVQALGGGGQGAGPDQGAPVYPNFPAGGGAPAPQWRNMTPPAVQGQWEAANRQQQEAAGSLARFQNEQSDALADMLSRHRRAGDKRLADDQAWAADQRAKMEQDQAEQQQRSRDIANKKVDPNHYWSSMDPFNRARLSLASGLSAFGSALTKTPDNVAKMIQDSISQDIDSQKQNIENQKDGLKNDQSLLAQKWRNYGNEQQARASTRAEMTNMMAQEGDEIRARYAGAINSAQGDAVVGRLRQDAADHAASTWKLVQPPSASSGMPSRKEIGDKVDDLVKAGAQPREALSTVLYGYGLGPEPQGNARLGALGKGANANPKVAEHIQAYDDAISTMQKLDDMAAKGVSISPEERARGDALIARATNQIPRAEIGTERPPGESEQKLLVPQVGENPTHLMLSPGANRARIQTTLAGLREGRARLTGEAPAPSMPSGFRGVQ